MIDIFKGLGMADTLNLLFSSNIISNEIIGEKFSIQVSVLTYLVFMLQHYTQQPYQGMPQQ